MRRFFHGIILAIFAELVALTAPAVCLFYRRGWYLTPDDPVSPFGCGLGASDEPFMRRLYARFGTFVGDWWWLGLRNRAYGLSYALKPEHFKRMRSYHLEVMVSQSEHYGPLRVITVDGFKEYTLSLGFAHVIAGWRLRPIWSAIAFEPDRPVRAVNMDARPILSIRTGGRDD